MVSADNIFKIASVAAGLLAFIFYALMSKARSIKQRSWIVTLLSSSTMSLGSLPFLWDFCSSGGLIRPVPSTDTFAEIVCGAFQGFLLADLILGSLYYRSQISLLFGWVHHISYAVILPYVSRRGWAPIFALCLAMEIPTCHLSVSFIWPRWRNDRVNTAVFFLFRIALHTALLLRFSTPTHAAALVQGSSMPAFLLTLAFALHLSAFVKNTRSIMRKGRKERNAFVANCSPRKSIRLSLSMRRRSSLREYFLVKSRSPKVKRRGAMILAVPVFYTLAKVCLCPLTKSCYQCADSNLYSAVISLCTTCSWPGH